MNIAVNDEKRIEKGNKYLKVDPSDLFDLAEIMFDQGKSITVRVTGNSMYPFLRNNVDSVEVRRTGINEIKVADIVLAKRKDGNYILHRVFKKIGDEFYMIGDAQDYLDGPYSNGNLIGIVTAIYRKEKRIPCSSNTLRFLVRLWMLMRPVRLPVIRSYIRFRNLGSKKTKKD